MADGIFRNVTTETVEEPKVESKTPDVDGEAEVETPYTEYEGDYVADYFKLGNKLDVFADELTVIDEYIDGLIDSGKIANSTKAVEKILKDMEKFTNIKDEERSVIRIEVIKAHIDFLNKTDQARKDFGKYN